MRCDHCEFRNGWDCGDGWNRTDDNHFCVDFRLDFETLTDKEKKIIQRKLMKESRDE